MEPGPATDTVRAGPVPPVPGPLVWLDLEMTGLDVRRHVIVEIAVLVTTTELEPLDEGLDLVVHQPATALAGMEDVVREMHTRSGLLAEIERSPLGLTEAVRRALDYLEPRAGPPGTAPLCGNSIGVDRRFLDAQAPELDRFCHYRSIDVSSLKELCRRWYPDVYRRRPVKRERHRALDDVRESIEELRYYRSEMLRPPVPGGPVPVGTGPGSDDRDA